MRFRPILIAGILLVLPALAAQRQAGTRPAPSRPEDWQPITEAEKAMKDCPQQPGAPAVYLYREETINPDDETVTHIRRLKILTPAGKDRANIEIPVVKGLRKLNDLKARVVRPDGEIRQFTGQVFDKTAVRSGRFKITFKTFALPDVDAGCIIDYRYQTVPDSGSSGLEDAAPALQIMGSSADEPYEGGVAPERETLSLRAETWDIQEDLFTVRARFAYKPSVSLAHLFSAFGMRARLNWVSHLLTGPRPAMNDGWVELIAENIPAFEAEELMTPEGTERMEVRFFYVDGKYGSPEAYWTQEAADWQKGVEKFIGKSAGIARESQTLTAGTADPFEKVKALYRRTQQIKNLSYDKTMTDKRRKELKIKINNKAEDVLKHNYGWRSNITRTFVALVQGAGLDARIVRAGERDDKFFDKTLCSFYDQLDRELAVVKINGQDKFFDPAMPFCPPGLIEWVSTDTTCLNPSNAPPEFLTIPVYPPDTAATRFDIAFQLDAEGNLTGTVKAAYRGQDALVRRLEHIGDDKVEVKKDLEKEMSGLLPDGAKVSLKKVENIDNSADILWAEFDVSIPAIATAAGQRTLLPVSPLLGSAQHPFRHAQRKHPIYFPYPCQETTDIVVTLPPGMKIETAPAPRRIQQEGFDYSLAAAPVEDGSKIHVLRDLVIKKSHFPVGQYPAVKGFFDQVRAADEEQIVLSLEKEQPDRDPRRRD